MFNAFSFDSLDIGYMFNLFTKKLIIEILCACGWQESLGTMISVRAVFCVL
jgi:hypothetical protein